MRKVLCHVEAWGPTDCRYSKVHEAPKEAWNQTPGCGGIALNRILRKWEGFIARLLGI